MEEIILKLTLIVSYEIFFLSFALIVDALNLKFWLDDVILSLIFETNQRWRINKSLI